VIIRINIRVNDIRVASKVSRARVRVMVITVSLRVAEDFADHVSQFFS
jgi:hypothetical protein